MMHSDCASVRVIQNAKTNFRVYFIILPNSKRLGHASSLTPHSGTWSKVCAWRSLALAAQ